MAIFTTQHHSLFIVIGENVRSLLGFFKTQFLDGLSSGATASATQPSCAGESAARVGYSVESSAGPTVYWCFGIDSSGQRVLRVVNNRRYPLEIEHPGLPVAERPVIDYGSVASLSHLLSGHLSILAPGAQIGYRVSLVSGQAAGAQTAVDGFGESLFALQTAINVLLTILTRFGVGGASKSITVMNDALGDAACANAMLAGHPGAIVASCLSPKDMVDDFGTAGLLLAPLAAVGGLADFFASEFQQLRDILTGRDTYRIIVTNTGEVPSCPSYGQLLSAWQAAPGSVAQTWAAPGTAITGFRNISCWQGWVVAVPVGEGNGFFVFSQTGGVHLLSPAELQQFTSAVCSAPDSPSDWKNPADGPANC